MMISSFTALARQFKDNRCLVDDRDEGIVDTIGKGATKQGYLIRASMNRSKHKKSTVLPDGLLGNLGASDIRLPLKGCAGTF